jgi:hypothetical protein
MRERAYYSQRCSAAAFTIMEVMIALVVLCIGLMAMLTQYATLQVSRHEANTTARVQELVRKIVEQVAAADPNLMGLKCADNPVPSATAWPLWTPEDAGDLTPFEMSHQPWSLARFEPLPSIPDVTTDYPPLTERAALPVNDLFATRLISKPTGIPDLKIYFEYYRANRGTLSNGVQNPAETGLIDGDSDDPDTVGENDLYNVTGDFREWFQQNVGTFVERARLVPNNYLLSERVIGLPKLIPEDEPFVVHVVATWQDDQRRIEAFTAKRLEK